MSQQLPSALTDATFDSAGRYIRTLITISDEALEELLCRCTVRTVPRRAYLSHIGDPINEVYFVHVGLLRVVLVDTKGTEHTTHLAYEGRLFAEYTAYLTRTPAAYYLQALEDTTLLVMPRNAIDWGYSNLSQGDRLGRFIAEQYFVYLDQRVRALMTESAQQRYDALTTIFPLVHARVPQHMLASYLGITPEYLSRMKRAAHRKSEPRSTDRVSE